MCYDLQHILYKSGIDYGFYSKELLDTPMCACVFTLQTNEGSKQSYSLDTAHSNGMVMSGLGEHMRICDLPSFQHNEDWKTYEILKIQPFVSNVYII